MLLKVMKLFDEKLEMTDVSRDVFEILEVTGFSELLSVKKALTEIDITGKEIIGRGAFGTAYRLDDERIVKVYRGDLGLDYIEREQRFAKAAFVSGIPSVMSFDVVKVSDSYGVVLEAINSDTLARVMTRESKKMTNISQSLLSLQKSCIRSRSGEILLSR